MCIAPQNLHFLGAMKCANQHITEKEHLAHLLTSQFGGKLKTAFSNIKKLPTSFINCISKGKSLLNNQLHWAFVIKKSFGVSCLTKTERNMLLDQ